MSEESSALTANRQAKNIRVVCKDCGAKKKVTVHVDAHDRYFFFDVPLETVWPSMTAEDANILEAHKDAYGLISSTGRMVYTCDECNARRERLWRKHINEEAEAERL